MLDLNCIPNCKPTNEVADKSGYHISYNWSSRDYGCPTTAIYIKDTGQYLILCNNHKDALETLENLDQCVKYFYDNIDQAHRFSDHGKVWEVDESGKLSCTKGGY